MKKGNIKFYAAALAAVMSVSSFSSVSAADDVLKGDVNSDGVVNAQDISVYQNYLLNNTVESFDKKAADMDKNDNINIIDLIMLKRMIIDSMSGNTAEEHTADITFNGSKIDVKGKNVVAEGSVVKITASGSYYFEGTLDDGEIYVEVPDKTADAETVKLFFNGVTIHGVSGPAVYVENAKNTSINLVEGTENFITDGDYSAVSEDTLAAVYAKDDLTIKGTGSLQIDAASQYGIHCGADLKVNGAELTVNTEAEDGIRGKKSVTIKDGDVTVEAEGDGIKSTKGTVEISGGKVHVKAGKDAVQAETSVTVSGGKVSAGGDRGITAPSGVSFTGGQILITAKDEKIDLAEGISIGAINLEFANEKAKDTKLIVKSGDKDVFSVKARKKFNYAFLASDAFETSKEYTVFADDTQLSSKSGKTFKPDSPSDYTVAE